MKTKTITVCDAIHINVLCAYNDYADIKCGGSPTLGYDFFVSPDEDKLAMTKFIKKCLKEYVGVTVPGLAVLLSVITGIPPRSPLSI